MSSMAINSCMLSCNSLLLLIQSTFLRCQTFIRIIQISMMYFGNFVVLFPYISSEVIITCECQFYMKIVIPLLP